jgi:hypothetical protein
MAIGSGVTLKGYFMEAYQFTVLLSGSIVAADVGKALTQDTTVANTFKLAGDGDPIHARLETYEDRVQEGIKVGTAAFHFANELPIKSGLTAGAVVAVGSTLVGAGAGEVKNAAPVAGVPVVRVMEVVGLKATALKVQ